MHSSGSPSGNHPTSYDRWTAGRPKVHAGLHETTFLPPSRPRKSEDALQQTELLSVGTVCADVAVLMDKEISGH
jgi:hypothetical protein